MENHGLQCGYCTPGMVMAAVGLLDENPHPTEQEVRIGLEGNLCRCTGYHNIVEVGARRRGRRERTHDRHRGPHPPRVIGTRMLRREDPALLTGEAKFTDDLDIPGALHLAVLRSPYAHARILQRRRRRGARAMPGVVAAYTGADLADAWAGADAVRLAGHRRHEEPAALPARRRQGVLRRRRRGRACWPRATPRPATRSTRSTSSTSRCRRSSTSRTRCQRPGRRSTTSSAPTRATRGS